jgi:hypothetical protein
MQDIQEKSKESQAAIADARQKTLSDPKYFGKISVSASKSDRIDGGHWQLTVFAKTLRPNDYDEAKVQAVLISPGKPDLPINLTDRRNGSLRTFVASLDRIGTKVVVCFSARKPAHPEPLRMTESFNGETYAAAEYGANGKQASFVPSAPATLSPVSNAPCGAQESPPPSATGKLLRCTRLPKSKQP